MRIVGRPQDTPTPVNWHLGALYEVTKLPTASLWQVGDLVVGAHSPSGEKAFINPRAGNFVALRDVQRGTYGLAAVQAGTYRITIE